MNVAIFVGVVTIAHLIAYALFVRWTSKVRPSDNAAEGEIIKHEWDEDLCELNNPLPGWWLKLFYFMIAVGAVYLVLYPGVFANKFDGLLNWSQIQQYEQESSKVDSKASEYFAVYESKSVEELAQIPEALASGRRIFLNNCAVCHGTDAGGISSSYPNLTDNDWIWGGEPENIVTTITNGRIGAMPAGGALPDTSDETLTAVAHYVMQLGGHPADETLAQKGQELYAQSCIACHGADGTGNQALGAPNLADDVWLYSDSANVEDIKSQIINPKNYQMPAWHDVLGDTRIKVVAAYVYSLSH